MGVSWDMKIHDLFWWCLVQFDDSYLLVNGSIPSMTELYLPSDLIVAV